MPHPIRAKLQHIRDLTPTVREVTFSLVDPPELPFRAGQSLTLLIPPAQKGVPLVRHYSLASPPSKRGTFSLLWNAVDHGQTSHFLSHTRLGDEVHFMGPNGSFCLQEKHPGDILFVATGTGIAPFRSMLHTLLERPLDQKVTLFWGLRREQDVYYQDELNRFTQHHPGFSFQMTLTRAGREWKGSHGRVTQLVEQVSNVHNLTVYLCGHHRMVNEVTTLVRRKGHCLIYREQPMAEAEKTGKICSELT